jgi:hypothetical protein
VREAAGAMKGAVAPSFSFSFSSSVQNIENEDEDDAESLNRTLRRHA